MLRREQVGRRVPEGPLVMPATGAREQWWARASEAAARFPADALAGAGQPRVEGEAEHDTRRVDRQGDRSRSCEVLAPVDLDDLAIAVAVPHECIQAAAFAGRRHLRQYASGEVAVGLAEPGPVLSGLSSSGSQ